MANRDAWKQWRTRLKAHLKEKGPSRSAVAGKLPGEKKGETMALSTLRSLLNGHREPKVRDFFALCEAAEVPDPAVILFGHPIMSPELKAKIGAFAVEILEADPSVMPSYGDTITKIKKDAKKRNIGRDEP